jgi:hypothetical protein
MTPLWMTISLVVANVAALGFGTVRTQLLTRRVRVLENSQHFLKSSGWSEVLSDLESEIGPVDPILLEEARKLFTDEQ